MAIAGLTIEGAGIDVAEGADVTLVDVGAGPCPQCGKPTFYLDGVYSARDDLITLSNAPGTTVVTLRNIALTLARAAENGTHPDKVGRQVGGRLPGFITWMKKRALSKNARQIIYSAIASAIATVLAEHAAQTLWKSDPQTVVNNYFKPTIIENVQRESGKSRAERERTLQETLRLLRQSTSTDGDAARNEQR